MGASQVLAAVHSPGWRSVYLSRAAQGSLLLSVAAPSRNDAWAVGEYVQQTGPIILHWNGKRWLRVRVRGAGASFEPASVYATSPSDVWIFGSIWRTGIDEALRFNGTDWETLQLPINSGAANETAVLSATSAWAINPGSCLFRCSTPATYWNGADWLVSRVQLDLWGIAAGGEHVFAVAVRAFRPADQTFVPVLYERARGRWLRCAAIKQRLSNPVLSASSASDVWIWGYRPGRGDRSVLYHWNGTQLRRVAIPAGLATSDVLTADGRGGVWAGPFAHWTGRKWISLRADASRLDGLLTGLAPVAGSRSTWLVGGLAWHGRDESFVAVNGKTP
ncbi:MAG: hypothetical protein ACLQFR_21660 [Streptosporangiaceae bacterium]